MKRNIIGGVGRSQVPDKKVKPVEGGNQMVVPINIVCPPNPMQNEIKTVCSYFQLLFYDFFYLITIKRMFSQYHLIVYNI